MIHGNYEVANNEDLDDNSFHCGESESLALSAHQGVLQPRCKQRYFAAWPRLLANEGRNDDSGSREAKRFSRQRLSVLHEFLYELKSASLVLQLPA